jgi:hypothetical protein
MLAEEEGHAPSLSAGDSPLGPRRLSKWALPLGAAASVLLVLGAGVAFWPGRSTNFYAFWNRGAFYAAKGDYGRAQDDLNTARALNPDDSSRAKIEEALTAVNASAAQAAQPQASEIEVLG